MGKSYLKMSIIKRMTMPLDQLELYHRELRKCIASSEEVFGFRENLNPSKANAFLLRNDK